jgi:hypothetical protein
METKSQNISIESTPSTVFEVISTLGGLRSWWTNALSGNPDKNGDLVVLIGGGQQITYNVSALKKNSSMTLKVTDGILNEESEREALMGTSVTLKLSGGGTRNTHVECMHDGWAKTDAFYKRYYVQWESRLASLKKLCEDGKGDPEIVQIPRK